MTGLSKISLQLARCPEFPEGNPRDGYEIVAPLDEAGRLDTEAWHAQRDHCRVRRLAPDGATRHGRLLHRAGGAGGASWVFDYDDRSDADDEVSGEGDGTRVRLVHSGFELPRNEIALTNMGRGWKSILPRLGDVAGEDD